MIKANTTVLFQGDSITDAGRSRENDTLLGEGYPAMVAARLKSEYPQFNVKVLNKGVSGDRSRNLVERWQADCIDIQPDYVSILIGINDTWRKYDSNDPTSDSDFEANLRLVIERTQKETKAEILLFVPFILDVNKTVSEMREDLCGKQEVVIRLAKEYGIPYVELDKVYKELCKNAQPVDFSNDGVHPNERGHGVIADEWFKIW